MEIRIYYEDTDAGGIVYHANYLHYFERARTEFFRERGLSVRELHELGCIFPVVRVEVDFRAPARHDDLLRVETEIIEVEKTSFLLGQQVVRTADGVLLVCGKVKLACVSPAMKAKRLPPDLLRALEIFPAENPAPSPFTQSRSACLKQPESPIFPKKPPQKTACPVPGKGVSILALILSDKEHY